MTRGWEWSEPADPFAAAAATQMLDESQQVRPQLQSLFLSPGSPAALAKKTPPRGLQPLYHAPSPNGEPRHGVGGGSSAGRFRPQPSPIGQR